jgi:hypothetical protein
MTTPAAPKISLAQQIEAVDLAIVRQRALATSGRVQEMRPKSAAQYDVDRLTVARRSLQTLLDNVDDIRALLDLPKPARAAGMAMAMEIVRKEALARAGGPA